VFDPHARMGLLERAAGLRNEPKTPSTGRFENLLNIWPIFVRAATTGGMRRSDVMGSIGEMPGYKDVNGRSENGSTESPRPV
jgi:hypothetical protein